MSVSELLRNTARLFPDKTAIYFNDFLITYRSLDQGVDNLARGLLNLGLKRQEMVGLLMGNCSDFVYSYFAIIRAGGVVVPVNPLYKDEEVKYLLNQAEVEEKMLNFLLRLGYPFRKAGPGKFYFGAYTTPAYVTLSELSKTLELMDIKKQKLFVEIFIL